MKRTSAKAGLSLYVALFSDIAAWDPDLRKPLDLDLKRLERMSEVNLEKFLMIDLPSAGKLVDMALSSGFIFNYADFPSSMGKLTDSGPREFLSSLFQKIFSDTDRIREDADPNAVVFLRQVLYMAKKVRKDCSDATLTAEVRDFLRIDSQLRNPTLGWDASSGFLSDRGGLLPRLSFVDGYYDSPDLVSERDVCPKPLLLVLDRVCRILFSQFRLLDWRELRPGHGPGAVADSRSGADKYLFPTWPGKLEGVFPQSYFARSREDLEDSGAICEEREVPARLIAVPKTLKAPRLIAAEPTSHQYMQHALMNWLRESLPAAFRSSIDFHSQIPSRQECLKASESGEMATVDLSAASDRLSCWVVERALQVHPGLLEALWAVRTRTLIPSVKGSNGKSVVPEEIVLLKKFAPQGSGVTFPVQSLIYASCCAAVMLYETGHLKPRYRDVAKVMRTVRVFGDDIIMPSYAVSTLAILLHHLQLKVNATKTHWRGFFRESCGMDAYRGFEVSATYLSAWEPGSSCQDLTSWVDVSNNFHRNGYFHVAEEMVRMIGDARSRLMPRTSQSMACLTLFTFCPGLKFDGKKRVNRHLHRPEVLALTSKVKTEHRKRETHQSLLQYFVEEPSPTSLWQAGWSGRKQIALAKCWVPSL